MNNMCEQILAIKRIEAIIESRNRLIEAQEGLKYISDNDDYKKVIKTYEKFEQSYADIIIAEAKYLESLKEYTEEKQNELTATKVLNEDLKYLKDVAEKEFLVYKHEKSKEPCVINISLNIDKDIDIETIASELVEKLKSVSI